MKSKIKLLIITFISLFVVIASILSIKLFVFDPRIGLEKAPLEWCLWKISQTKDYENYNMFTYEEAMFEKKKPNIYDYLIDVYTNKKIGKWMCSIKCESKNFMYNMLANIKYKKFLQEETNVLNCELITEQVLNDENV